MDTNQDRHARANGIEIHYVEAGAGTPLVLLNNGMVSTHPVWRGSRSSYGEHLEAFAQHFRVIAPDLRGSGRTRHPGGALPHALLADDVAALIEALGLDRPLLCGFSDGGTIATVVGLRSPRSVRAIVNHAGHDMFNPDPHAPGLLLTRQMLGGGPEATEADPEAVAHSPFLAPMVEMMKADHDAAQGPGHWKTVLQRTFERVSRPSGYTFQDLRALCVPTLILAGDRDPFCTVEDGVAAYRQLADGELAILPGAGHEIGAVGVAAIVEFLRRRLNP